MSYGAQYDFTCGYLNTTLITGVGHRMKIDHALKQCSPPCPSWPVLARRATLKMKTEPTEKFVFTEFNSQYVALFDISVR